MQELEYSNYANYVISNIGKGAFLTVKNNNKLNTMTIGWGSVGVIWGKPIFMVMVRKSRYTYDIIENNNEFTISFPKDNQLKKELMFCGSNSGYDYDKFKECNLTPVQGKKVNTPIIAEANLHFECSIVYKQNMDDSNLDQNLNDHWYPDKNFHTLYYAEIISCYTT